MNKELKQSYRGATILNLLISAGATGLLLLVLTENLTSIIDLVGNVLENLGIDRAGAPKYTAVLMAFAGITLNAVVFMILQSQQAAYIKTIDGAMKELSKGNLDIDVPVRGFDELASLAASLNTMADDIKTLIERERQTEKSKNELITNVAHDLRTPLTSILGYLELLDKRTDIDEETRRKYTAVAYDKARHLQELIEELFGFTKLNYGRIALKPVTLDMVALLNQLIDEFYPVFEKAGIECTFSSSVPELKMQADGTLIARLFDNLINNAVKYGKDGKQIIVRLVDGDQVVITVKNYGAVIPENEIPYLFNKFYRVEQSRSSSTGGTGLGLAIAQNIASLHGGSIGCASDINGTVFTVKLPKNYDFEGENFDSR